ncbi:hypothetical protein [Chitinophaga pinensis]|uniref:hypothetical protein n=1 Tax=Chitinophaga pinensis TaxID=79329 RepID=UPI00019E2868|nr:hypothetical protein [Chitinophaga pinensis]
MTGLRHKDRKEDGESRIFAYIFSSFTAKPLAFIAICYQCRKASVSEERISIGDPCLEKLQLLKQFFKEAGIKFGVE